MSSPATVAFRFFEGDDTDDAVTMPSSCSSVARFLTTLFAAFHTCLAVLASVKTDWTAANFALEISSGLLKSSVSQESLLFMKRIIFEPQ